MTILETKKLVKSFGGVHAVDHLSIAVKGGVVTALIGPNGSGKTTLLNTLCGTLPIDGGTVVVSGVHLTHMTPHEVPIYGITRTFQEVRLFNQMPVLDNLIVVLTERNVVGAHFEHHTALHTQRAEELLRKMNLWEKRYELAVNLSYGQRKLLEIARALAMGVEIYLFDEPFAGLFPKMRTTVSEVIQQLRDRGKTVLLIEHHMEIIRELSDYVFVMASGELLAEGEPNDVLKRREVIEAYLGA
jgi:branched-chain amino acid transport system ATP-binding protein